MADRDVKGRFVKGHKVPSKGAGRPPRAREQRYNDIMMTTCSFKAWKSIVAKAVEQALEGNYRARQGLSEYLLGKPTQSVDVNLTGELELFMRELVGLGDGE